LNYGNSRGAYAARRTTGVQYVPREEVEKPKLSLVKVEIGGTLANSVFTTILFVVVIAGFLGVMLLNIAVSSLSIRATDLENQISKLNQDSQALTVQMEEKGSVILQEASKMGMILRDKTVVVNFDNNNISNYQLTKEEADRAYEASVQH
jgi:cell division protein FtsL